MVVDDSNAIRSLVCQQLEDLGYKNTLQANNGKDAISKLDQVYQGKDSIQLLIIDWKMPEVDGLELLKNL